VKLESNRSSIPEFRPGCFSCQFLRRVRLQNDKEFEIFTECITFSHGLYRKVKFEFFFLTLNQSCRNFQVSVTNLVRAVITPGIYRFQSYYEVCLSSIVVLNRLDYICLVIDFFQRFTSCIIVR
jgi:hypothetical protein